MSKDGFSGEKDIFHQTKEVVSRLREPIKIKAVPYATTKLRGHQIQIELNISWDQIDEFTGKNGIIIDLIKNMKYHIENSMKSKYLGVIMPDEIKDHA